MSGIHPAPKDASPGAGIESRTFSRLRARPALLVDDSVVTRQLLRRILLQVGQGAFLEAGNGVEALERLAAIPGGPGLIICDWKMPVMDGLEFLRTIRAQGIANDSPFVILSAESAPERILEALESGAHAYVIKPFQTSELRMKIREAARVVELQGLAGQAASGDLADVSALTVLTFAILRRFTARLRATLADGSVGEIELSQGIPVHAELGETSGDEAALLLATLRAGRFELVTTAPSLSRNRLRQDPAQAEPPRIGSPRDAIPRHGSGREEIGDVFSPSPPAERTVTWNGRRLLAEAIRHTDERMRAQ